MNTQTHTENAHVAVDHLSTSAQFWEQKARDTDEGYSTLLQDHTVLKAEFDDITANAEWLASIIRSHLSHLPEAREALDASPRESVARLQTECRWEWKRSAELQSRPVRNFSNVDDVFDAVPLELISPEEEEGE